MPVCFKQSGDHLYAKLGGAFKQLNNIEYLDASLLSKGLMTTQHVRDINTLKSKSIKSADLVNGVFSITAQDNSKIIDGVRIDNNYIPILNQNQINLSADTRPFIHTHGQYKVNQAFSVDPIRDFYNTNTTSRGWNASQEEERNNPTRYEKYESRTQPMFYMHRIVLQGNPSLSSTEPQYLKVDFRINNSDGVVGVCFKKGDTLYVKYSNHTSPNSIVTEGEWFDITGITGNHIVVFGWSSKWYNVATNAKIYRPKEQMAKMAQGTYQEFQAIKDRFITGYQFFITDINNRKGCLACKVGDTWRDALGNPITSQNHRVTV